MRKVFQRNGQAQAWMASTMTKLRGHGNVVHHYTSLTLTLHPKAARARQMNRVASCPASSNRSLICHPQCQRRLRGSHSSCDASEPPTPHPHPLRLAPQHQPLSPLHPQVQHLYLRKYPQPHRHQHSPPRQPRRRHLCLHS